MKKNFFLILYYSKWKGLAFLIVLLGLSIYFSEGVQIDLDFQRVLSTGVIKNVSKGTNSKYPYQMLAIISSPNKSVVNKDVLISLEKIESKIKNIDKGIVIHSLLDAKVWDIVNGELKKESVIYDLDQGIVNSQDITKMIRKSYNQLSELVNQDLSKLYFFIEYTGSDKVSGVSLYNKIESVLEHVNQGSFIQAKFLSVHSQKKHDQVVLNSEVPRILLGCLLIVTIIVGIMAGNLFYSIVLIILNGVNMQFALFVMNFFGWKITLVGLLLPLLIIVVGSTQIIHLVSSYVTNLKRLNYDKEEAIKLTYSMLSLPCVLTSVTTAFGMVSFLLSRSQAVREFGACSSIVMLICGVVALFLCPLFFAFIPVRKGVSEVDLEQRSSRVSVRSRIASILSNRLINTILVGCILIVFCIKVQDVKQDMRITNNFREGHVFSNHVNDIHKEFGGMGRMILTIQSPEKNIFLNTVNQDKLITLTNELKKNKNIYAAYSFANVISELSKRDGAMMAFLTLDRDQLFNEEKSSSQLYEPINSQFNKVKVYTRVNMRYVSEVASSESIIKKKASALFGNEFKYSIDYPQQKQMILYEKILEETVYSLLLCIVFIFLIFSIQYRSALMGGLALIPNILTGFVMYCSMGYLGIYLSPFNVATFIIVLSIGVDFTIHMYMAFRRQMNVRSRKYKWCESALYQVISPLFLASIAFSVPMMLVLFSSHAILFQTGVLMSIGIFMSLVMNILVNSVVFLVIEKKRMRMDSRG